jgi:phospholipid:diacylglycerol acyltransferase
MLRRRTGKDKVPQPDDSLVSGSSSEEARLRAEFGDAKVKQLILKPRSKRRNGFIFVLGGLFGIFIALFFANQSEVISLDSLMDLNLESLMDAIPQGIVSDVKQFSVSDPERAALLSLRYVHVTDDLGAIAARTRYRQL